MEQYTAKQWAEIEGGHTMSENKKGLSLSFIGKEVTESRMFRSKKSKALVIERWLTLHL